MGRATLFVDLGDRRPRFDDRHMRRLASRRRLEFYLWETQQCTLFMC